tara:strand:- start:1283 stop:1591 length:309 start_codon:yes stop_codon:yes gene_type:complete
MARRKNTKRIDPRYFLNETTYRDEVEEGMSSYVTGPDPKDALTTAQAMALKRAVDSGAEGVRMNMDLKTIMMQAAQGRQQGAIDLLNDPAFQDDPRVKDLGY